METHEIDKSKPRHKCMTNDECCRCRNGGPDVVIEQDDGTLHSYCRPCAQAVLKGK